MNTTATHSPSPVRPGAISIGPPAVLAAVVIALLLACGSNALVACIVGAVTGLWGLGRQQDIARKRDHSRPVSPSELAEHGLGPLSPDASANDLYLDTVKRSLMNIVYHESSHTLWRFDPEFHVCKLLPGMDLGSRVRGEDVAGNTLTMVGSKRLDNIRHCVEVVLQQNVPGDLIETGARKGGACIYMKAVLRANESHYGSGDRRVFVCDVFSSPKPPPNALAWVIGQPILMLLALLTLIPIRSWKRALFRRVQKMQASFPPVEDSSDDMVNGVMFIIRNLWSLRRTATSPGTGTGEENVRSHFARLGLLDERVMFLRGFFADTLGDAPIDEIALLRLDGDTYESTMDALGPLYPKLSTGGFCIIDDYDAFEECRQAVDEYRSEHGIEDPLHRIDDMAVFWVKDEALARSGE